MATIAPPPIYTDIIQLDEQGRPLGGRYLFSRDVLVWIQQSLIPPIQASGTLLTPVSLTNQSATIAVTPIPLPALASGVYRITTYARITTADGAGSSLAVTIGWTESTVSLSKPFAAMTGDTTTTVDSQTFTMVIDQASPITYAAAYSSTTPAKMRFRLTVKIEAL